MSKTSKVPSAARKRSHRRVRRACDDCRGRKVKCDGTRPCASCTNLGQECTYTSTGKSKYAGPLYIQELEYEVAELKERGNWLKSFLLAMPPKIHIEAPQFDTSILAQLLNENLGSRNFSGSTKQQTTTNAETEAGILLKHEELLETMIEDTGKLDINGDGQCEYHGGFGGLAFLHQINKRFVELLKMDLSLKKSICHLRLQPGLGSTSIPLRGPSADSMILFQLPSHAAARHLCKVALEDAPLWMNFIHQPSFYKSLARVYSLSPENFSAKEESFLPLLYATLAIGELFAGRSERQEVPAHSLEQMKGIKWFRAAQASFDAANSRDITSLQTLVCIVIYLQPTALMYSCSSYISMALSLSLQMGLHRSAASSQLSSIEQETRKRVFWILQTMETYVTTLLGLPTTLSDEDFDQEQPICVDDAFITTEGSLPMTVNGMSTMTCVNAHIRLLIILRNVVKDIYPRARNSDCKSGGSYRVKYGRITKIEAELDEWFQSIPTPSQTENLQSGSLRTQLLLRLAYAHVQMVLYRPFIHHIIRGSSGDIPEMRSYTCASACVKAAMQVVWIVEKLEKHGLLISTYWFTAFIIFFAVTTLCMFVIGNPDGPTLDDTLKAAEKGRDILARMSLECVCAERCIASLGTIFNNISLARMKRLQDLKLINGLSNSSTNSDEMATGDISHHEMDSETGIPSIINSHQSNLDGVDSAETTSFLFANLSAPINATSCDDFDAQADSQQQLELLASTCPLIGFPFPSYLDTASYDNICSEEGLYFL